MLMITREPEHNHYYVGTSFSRIITQFPLRIMEGDNESLVVSSALLFLGRECMRRLVVAVDRQKPGSRTRILLENDLGRFKIWAGSIGLFALGRSGIDYRFGQDERARDVVSTMLEWLKRRLAPKTVEPHAPSPRNSNSASIVREMSGKPVFSSPSTLLSDEFRLEEDSLEEDSLEEDSLSDTPPE
jgi:hypothetical protein